MAQASSGETVFGNGVPFLEARAVHLWRGERHLLRGVTFSLREGDALQLAGPNGVGKSSLLRIACGLLPCDEGEVFWRGVERSRAPSEFQIELAYFAHSNALKADLTASENLVTAIALRRQIGADECEAALERVGLSDCAQVPARALSAGQRRRLGLARVLLSAARLWVLDEPATNVDAAGTALIGRLMEEHLEQGGTILYAAHHPMLQGHSRSRLLELA